MQNEDNPNQEHEENNTKTPLEQVKEQQAAMRESQNVAEQRNDPSPEVPGASTPSQRRKHPQRQMYGQGTNES